MNWIRIEPTEEEWIEKIKERTVAAYEAYEYGLYFFDAVGAKSEE